MAEGENTGWRGEGGSGMKRRKIKTVNRSAEATAYTQIHRRKNTQRQSFPGKSSSLMRIYSAPFCDNQPFVACAS